jgi:hypothetical protein
MAMALSVETIALKMISSASQLPVCSGTIKAGLAFQGFQN